MMCLYNDYYSVYLLALFRMIPGCVVQSVMCRLLNMILTVNPGFFHTFLDIDCDIIFKVILLRNAESIRVPGSGVVLDCIVS